MSGPFKIELGPGFPAADKARANFEIGVFNAVAGAEIGLFKQAWAGWPSDDSAPKASRSDSEAQDMIDAGMKYAFGDLYEGR